MKKIVSYLTFFLPSLLILLVLLYFSNINKVAKTLLNIPWHAYIIILIIYAFSWILRGARWKAFLKLNKVKIKLIPATILSAFGNYANWVAPARIGDLAWAYAGKKVLKTKFSISLVTIIINRFLDFFALVIILQIIFITVAKELLVQWAKTINIISIFIVLLFILGIAIFSNEKLMNFFLKGPLKKLKKIYIVLRQSLLDSTNKKKEFVLWTLVSIVIWFLESLVSYILLLVSGYTIPYFIVLLAVVMGNLTKTLGITPGGTGTYEAAMALTLIALTPIEYSVALTLAIVDHFVKKIFVLIVGTIALNHYGLEMMSLSKKKLPIK